MIVFILLCCLCNASLLHLKANILEQEENAVAQLKAKVLDKQSQNLALLETGDDPVISPIPITLQIKRCCDPYAQPGAAPHARCPFGAPACCPNGQWVCPSNGPLGPTKYVCNGVEATGASLSSACIIKCCDPAKQFPRFGDPNWCLWGTHCCYTGFWVCGAEDGSYVCAGSKTTGITAYPCQTAAGLIDTGSDGATEVSAVVPRDRTTSEPQDTNVPVGASFLAQPELPPAARCCDALKEPGKYGNSICPYGHQCCLTGEWSCADADGVTFTCNGKLTKEPGGFPCPPDCKEVQCPRLPCPDWQQYTPKDACCPACLLCFDNRTPLSTTNCKLGKCPTGWNCEGKVVSDTSPTGWHTVGLCCKDCSRALCLTPRCPVWQQYTPEGECCPKCKLCHNGEAPWSSATDCSTNGGRCPGGYACESNIHFEPNGDWSTYGMCCHPDCRLVLCPRLDCPSERQIKPEGACCPFCKRATCLDGSTPMPGNCPTEQCPVGYSCNGFIDTPVSGGPWFSYGLCCKLGVVG